jgi:hypothetical protein
MPELERDLREYFDELAARAERPVREVDYTTLPKRRRRRGRHVVLVAAGVAVLVVAAVAVAAATAGRRDHGVGSGPSVTVEYERLVYHQRASLHCPAARSAGRYDSMVIETWGDRAGKRWRTRITYPDGSTRDVVAEGSPWYPTDHFSRGQVRGATLGCKDPSIGVLVAERQGDIVSLNPMADVPADVGEGSGLGMPLVPSYRDLGEGIAGTHRDSRGRLTRVWRAVTGGTTGSGRQPVDIQQTSEWYVIGDQVVEERFVNEYRGVATARWSLTLVGSGHRTVRGDWFATDGYEDLGSEPVPTAGTGSVTTVVSHGMVSRVSGRLEMVGGPSQASVDPASGIVSAVNAAGDVVATTHADAGGRFSFDLRPGRYQLVGRSPNFGAGLGRCQSGQAVLVGAQAVRGVLVLCQRK